MKAVLLAAGVGSRLAPLTDSVPKILAPLAGRPLLEHQLGYLARQGVTEVAINVHSHADQVLEFLESRDLPLAVRVSREPELLGTAGALVPLRDFVSEPVVILYGDVVTDANLSALVEVHARREAAATLTHYRSPEFEGKGVLELGADERVLSFLEKPAEVQRTAHVNAGVYVVSPRVLAYLGPGDDFGHDVWPAMLDAGEPLYGHELSGYLQDIGSPDALRQTELDLVAGAVRW